MCVVRVHCGSLVNSSSSGRGSTHVEVSDELMGNSYLTSLKVSMFIFVYACVCVPAANDEDSGRYQQ